MIKVTDIQYGRFQAPDLDRAEVFLNDFGLVRAARTDNKLFMRGSDPDHHLHITELGDPKFIGFAFKAESRSDLEVISKAEGATEVEEIDEPGGGLRVRITDPNGYEVEITNGIETLDPLPIHNEVAWNFGSDHRRRGELLRLKRGRSQVKRLGHAVLFVEKFEESVAFYQRHFGLLHSDAMYAEAEADIVAYFMRCDRGPDQYVDHHTLFLNKWPETQFHHLGFEVQDLNAIYIGHESLAEKGYDHCGGIGRHIQGAQIFDTWLDPWGRGHEHWTDSDLLNSESPMGLVSVSNALAVQWGDPPT